MSATDRSSDAVHRDGVRATSVCVPIDMTDWRAQPDASIKAEAVAGLERGDVLFFPHLPFGLDAAEQALLRPESVKDGTKTIKFDPSSGRVWGHADEAETITLKTMLGRYAEAVRTMLAALIPSYGDALKIGNTSFRPVEAQGRTQSKRHDDTLLHVDAFPSRPSHGERIMRVFTNIHPGDKPRVWRVGEPFETVASRFLPQISAPLPGGAKLMQMLGITKALRSAADHYMLKMHDRMKLDDDYQRNVPHRIVKFPPGSTWIVFTDQVSHAAMSGQHALEQTFTLSLAGMANPDQAPVRVLERLKGVKLH